MPARPVIRRAAPPPPLEDGGGAYFSSPKTNLEFISSGCVLLDCVLGGGWPLGRVVNIVGDKSTGKTLLAMEAVANFFLKYENGRCWYNEAEAAFDGEYARALGIPMDRVTLLEDHDTVEQVFEHLEDVLRLPTKTPGLYILDSLDALSDDAEMARKIGEGSYGANKPKKLGELFRRLVRKLRSRKICVIIVSQVRDAIGVTFGEKHRRSGGKALDFYASQALWLAHLGVNKQTKGKITRPIGVHIRAKCKKNKIGLPLRECEFNIRFGYGVEDREACLAWLKEVGSTTKENTAPEVLAQLVRTKWFEVEKTFLPRERKYG